MGLRNQPGGSLNPVSDALKRAVATPGSSGRSTTRAGVAEAMATQAAPPEDSASGARPGLTSPPGSGEPPPVIDLGPITAAIAELRASIAAALDRAAAADARATDTAGRLGYTFVQPIPATVWTITHDLGYQPSGQLVIASDGDVLEGFGVQILDPEHSLRLSFDLAFDGTAYLS